MRSFVASVRSEWKALAEPLAKSLGQEVSFVEGLLEVLDGLFIAEEP